MRIVDIIMLVVLVVVICVAVLVGANFQSAIGDMNLTGQANQTATTAFNNMWMGLTLASITIIISAAMGIIVLVLSTLGRFGGAGV